MSLGSLGAAALAVVCLAAVSLRAGETLVQVDKSFDLGKVRVVGEAKLSLSSEGHSPAIRVAVPKGTPMSGASFYPPGGLWDLSKYSYVMADVRNVGTGPARIRLRAANADVPEGAEVQFGIHPSGHFVNGDVFLEPGQSTTVQVELRRRKPDWIRVDLFGMVCYPWGQCQSSDPNRSAGAVDADKIASILLYVRLPLQDAAFEISSIRAVGTYREPIAILKDPDKFFPFIDEYGQYIHADWPNKVRAEGDFAQRRAAEEKDLAAHAGPADWDQYGGWKGGPQLEATGFFRVAKYNGKWWLVDPEGRLFLSAGMDCVSSREGATTITDREKYFRKLPDREGEFGEFYSVGRAFPRGPYAGRQPTSYDFTRANLLRKYGKDWPAVFADLAHRRLRSWGFNTMGNWSDPAIYGLRKTPYTANIRFSSKPLEGAEGWWGKSPDSFDPSFRENIRRAMALEANTTAQDPWCLGYFVGNEMEWGANDTDLARMTLLSPPEQAGKKVFVEDLKAKYGTIERLNAAWGTSHASWQALLDSNQPPDARRAHDDLAAFTVKTCENYFKTVADAVHEFAPGHLYLGCRFAGGLESPAVTWAAAKFCDVVSFNIYRRGVDGLRLGVPADVPLLIGEYSFWAMDCGKFNMGGLSLEAMEDQTRRAEGYKEFVHSVLRHPQLVGCHWFKYMDQATTGRGDGENFNFGFLDVADTPYQPMIDASRLLAERMYEYRMAAK